MRDETKGFIIGAIALVFWGVSFKFFYSHIPVFVVSMCLSVMLVFCLLLIMLAIQGLKE